MTDSRVASRYVKSLLSLAQEQQELETVHRDMQLFSQACKASRDLTSMLRSPIIRHDQKRNILTAIFKHKVHKLTMAIIDMLTRKNREMLLPIIAAEFHNAYNQFKGIEEATLTTAVAMDDKVVSEITGLVKKMTLQKEIKLEQKVDSDLIGGFLLKVGDKQIDASVKGKLKRLKSTLKED